MLHHLGKPKSLWAEAFSTATYIANGKSTKALDGRAYYEMLYDVKLDLADLRAFGASCAIVGPSEILKKRAWTVGRATSISGAHTVQAKGVIWPSWPIEGEVFEF